MADPLTIVGAVASTIQIIDVLTKAISVLDTLRAQWQSSDIALLSLTSQLGALSAALSKIQEWMESGSEEVHHQLVMDLSTSISCCKMLATKVYSEISDLQRAPGGSMLSTAKARFMFKRSGIGELQKMMDRQTAALTLLLTACNSKSLAAQQEILGTSGARKRMERVHEDTESLRGTLDSSSFLSRGTERSSRLSMLFDFDDQLFSSKSYKSMIRKTVKLSIRSPDKNAPGPEEVITCVSSNAVGSTSPTAPLLRNASEPIVRQRSGSKKLVLLGQGESAKTTFVKQLQWAYSSGFSTEERKTWRIIIHETLVTTFQSLVSSCARYTDLGDTFWNQVVLVQFAIEDEMDQLPPNFANVFRLLVESALKTPSDTTRYKLLSEDTIYFANHLDRICAPSYSPNSDDVFHARTRTTGIHRHVFNIPEHGPCKVYDVGGERAERKKWIHIFDQTATVVIFVPMDSYDQVLYEDENVSRMQEALTLFESLVNSENWWKESEIFLCFTKSDNFSKKIKSGTRPLNEWFPEYEGSPTDVLACMEYITKRFIDLIQQRSELEIFYVNTTCTAHVQQTVDMIFGNHMSGTQRCFHFYENGFTRYYWKREVELDTDAETL